MTSASETASGFRLYLDTSAVLRAVLEGLELLTADERLREAALGAR